MATDLAWNYVDQGKKRWKENRLLKKNMQYKIWVLLWRWPMQKGERLVLPKSVAQQNIILWFFPRLNESNKERQEGGKAVMGCCTPTWLQIHLLYAPISRKEDGVVFIASNCSCRGEFLEGGAKKLKREVEPTACRGIWLSLRHAGMQLILASKRGLKLHATFFASDTI